MTQDDIVVTLFFLFLLLCWWNRASFCLPSLDTLVEMEAQPPWVEAPLHDTNQVLGVHAAADLQLSLSHLSPYPPLCISYSMMQSRSTHATRYIYTKYLTTSKLYEQNAPSYVKGYMIHEWGGKELLTLPPDIPRAVCLVAVSPPHSCCRKHCVIALQYHTLSLLHFYWKLWNLTAWPGPQKKPTPYSQPFQQQLFTHIQCGIRTCYRETSSTSIGRSLNVIIRQDSVKNTWFWNDRLVSQQH